MQLPCKLQGVQWWVHSSCFAVWDSCGACVCVFLCVCMCVRVCVHVHVCACVVRLAHAAVLPAARVQWWVRSSCFAE